MRWDFIIVGDWADAYAVAPALGAAYPLDDDGQPILPAPGGEPFTFWMDASGVQVPHPQGAVQLTCRLHEAVVPDPAADPMAPEDEQPPPLGVRRLLTVHAASVGGRDIVPALAALAERARVLQPVVDEAPVDAAVLATYCDAPLTMAVRWVTPTIGSLLDAPRRAGRS